MIRRRAARWLLVIFVVGVGFLTILSRIGRSADQDGFTLGKAIVIAGYLALPALVLLAVGLLVVALLLGGGLLVERRNRRP